MTRAQKPEPDLPLSARIYFRDVEPLLSALREALRTEPAVGLAVLFGSRSRGDERGDSDVDVFVALRETSAARDLAARLSERLGLCFHVVSLADVADAPLLLAEIVRDGRVLIDRDAVWPDLMRRKSQILRAAARERNRVDREFAEAFANAPVS